MLRPCTIVAVGFRKDGASGLFLGDISISTAAGALPVLGIDSFALSYKDL